MGNGFLVDGGRVFQRKEVSIFELKEDSVIPLEHKMSMKILLKRLKLRLALIGKTLPWIMEKEKIKVHSN
ncbi:MAG: hypothetical protein CM1200mP12_20520 [Gammaproteobacteria bacterium]|nr:MAG: hypothetical protein CM1200mP12_20520 [Gammaproteobacteria bacterium]